MLVFSGEMRTRVRSQRVSTQAVIVHKKYITLQAEHVVLDNFAGYHLRSQASYSEGEKEGSCLPAKVYLVIEDCSYLCSNRYRRTYMKMSTACLLD